MEYETKEDRDETLKMLEYICDSRLFFTLEKYEPGKYSISIRDGERNIDTVYGSNLTGCLIEAAKTVYCETLRE